MKKEKRADLIKRLVVTLISGVYLAVLIYYLISKKTIVTGAFKDYNRMVAIILITMILFFFVNFAVYPIITKRARLWIFAIGTVMILLSRGTLINDIDTKMYLGDITQLIGAILVILSPTKLLIPHKLTKIKEEKQYKNAKVIEA